MSTVLLKWGVVWICCSLSFPLAIALPPFLAPSLLSYSDSEFLCWDTLIFFSMNHSHTSAFFSLSLSSSPHCQSFISLSREEQSMIWIFCNCWQGIVPPTVLHPRGLCGVCFVYVLVMWSQRICLIWPQVKGKELTGLMYLECRRTDNK